MTVWKLKEMVEHKIEDVWISSGWWVLAKHIWMQERCLFDKSLILTGQENHVGEDSLPEKLGFLLNGQISCVQSE